ncbi:MAG: hypothetical protein RL619_1957 [Bacteroidota bacterium]|jgi:uncharacterized BrkB/YihY/UPF0761 family membrane protein
MGATEHVKQNNKQSVIKDRNNRVFLYLGTFFVMIASLSIGVLILMFFLIKLKEIF